MKMYTCCNTWKAMREKCPHCFEKMKEVEVDEEQIAQFFTLHKFPSHYFDPIII